MGEPDDRTVVRISPPVPPVEEPPLLRQVEEPNPIVQAASRLLALTIQIRNSPTPPSDLDRLHHQLVQEIRAFESALERQSVGRETVKWASYLLCTVVDEAVLTTPWGNRSSWSKENLLALFHREVYGGERFFEILQRCARVPERFLDLLEFMFHCLQLGFEGTYRIQPGGRERLQEIRSELYRLLERHGRGEGDRSLSPSWRGVEVEERLIRRWPLWSIAALAAALLGFGYLTLLFWFNRTSDRFAQSLHAIEIPEVEMAQPAVAAEPPKTLWLRDLLAEEIRQGLLQVEEDARQAKVTLQSGQLFPSGRADVVPAVVPLLERVGEALEQVAGQILITGHTDNRPIRTARFPSNWHLSKARAEAVAGILRPFLSDPGRITTQGMADLEPIAPNDTAEGRARNRRVEILLLK